MDADETARDSVFVFIRVIRAIGGCSKNADGAGDEKD